ncbi:MAG: dTDP-glucose 4,6-dehydratase, partial [Elusimicrobiales bacterium]
MRMLVTGGYGFMGSNFIRYLFTERKFDGFIVNYDKLTYAANPLNLCDIEKKFSKRYCFVRGDICDYKKLKEIFNEYAIDTVVHFAAESHVDRSIYGPGDFIKTNINGTFILLEVVRYFKSKGRNIRFHHISTDEVYGSLGPKGYFYETTCYSPRSPYSASKASSDHLVRAYFHTYDIPITITNSSNNYGPYQFPEKLIPLMILNAVEGKKLPIYGDGMNVRDWIYVLDHASAVYLVLEKGRIGETYNIGGECEKKNIDVVNKICDILERIYPSSKNPLMRAIKYSDLITFVKDRPAHDRRYAMNCDKIKNELGWQRK